MPTSIDQLYIDINANAVRANDAIDRLVTKLDRLSVSLSKVNGSSITGLANGVQRLGTAMQTMNTVKTADFTRLANNLTKLGSLNVASLNSAASAMSQLTRSFNSLGAVSENAQQIGVLASNLSKLGNKGVTNAIANLPQLATAMRNLMATLSTAPRVSNNVIQMTNSLANLASQGRSVGSASTLLNTGLTKTSTTMKHTKSQAFSLAAAFGKFYASYFLVIRGVKSLWTSIQSTADYIESFNYQTVSLQKIASEWKDDYAKYGYENAEAYSDSFQKRLTDSLSKLSGIQINVEDGLLEETGLKNLGLNIKEITQYSSQLASVTNSVGLTGEASLAASTSFTKLAGDISSLFNMDYSSVMNNIQSGLIGQSRALYKYGIDITNATLQTYAYNLGLEKAVSEMTQAEKMQLRMIAILDQSKVSWGDLANTIESPSNMVRQFKNNLSELGIVFGQLFIPVLQKVLPYINGFTIALKQLLVSVATLFGVELDLSSFGQGYSEFEDDIEDVADAYDDATKAANKFKSATIGIDKLNIISPTEDTGKSGTGAGGSIDLTDEILKTTEEYEKVWNAAYKKMESKSKKIADSISKIFGNIANAYKTGGFEGVGDYISKSLEKQLRAIDWQKIYKGAKDFGKGLASFLNGLIQPETFEALGQTIAGALNTKLYSVLSFGKTFDFSKLGESIAAGINGFFDTFDFSSLAKSINVWVQGLYDLVITTTEDIDWRDVFKAFKDFISNIEFKTVAIALGAITIKKIASFSFSASALSSLSKAFTTQISKIAPALTSSLGNITPLQGIAGIGGGLAMFGSVQSLFYDLTKGVDDLSDSISNVAISAPIASTALYAAFGPAGLAFGGVTSLLGALTGMNEATKDLAQSEVLKTFVDNNAQSIDELIGKFDVLSESISSPYKSINEQLDKIDTSEDAINSTVENIDKIGMAITNGASTVEEKKDEIVKSFADLNTELMNVTDTSYATVSAFVTSHAEELESMGYDTDKWLTEAGKGTSSYKKKLEEFNTKINKLIDEGKVGTKEYNELLQQYYDFAGIEDETTKAIAESTEKLQNIIGKGINLEDFIKDGQLDTTALEKELSKVSKAYDDTRIEIQTAYDGIEEEIKSQFEKGIINKETYDQEIAALGKVEQSTLDELKRGLQDTLIIPIQESIQSGLSHVWDGMEFGSMTTGQALEFDRKLQDYGATIYSPIEKMLNGVFGDVANTGTNLSSDAVLDMYEGLMTTDNGVTYNVSEQMKKNVDAIVEKGFVIDTDKYQKQYEQDLKNIFSADVNLGLDFGLIQEKTKTPLDKILGQISIKTTPKAYATGGFPEDGLFYANHNELVGQFDNGKTAVANNKQITDGIEEASYRGFLRALSSQGSSKGNKGSQTINLVVDGKTLASVVNEENARMGTPMLGYETGY